MAREFSRLDRVAEQIQKELAQLIQRELKDPRLGMVTVNSVKVSKDLSYADVYVTVLNLKDVEDDGDASKASLKVLESAAGFLRSELGRAIKLRVMPQLRFHYDASVSNAQRLGALIQKARAKDSSASDSSDDSHN
ncbi:ribosome-binding factor A [Hahella chejuensis KCTC 2396]|uniref:Ribosome-binding factor A n=1 Tax=Hahella chejuensis (strain KCTC 2396) TaxID=349521 RepID=RBFA_HAHCH|nr:30S ribosome-binding factor RbfA [Hahella chejuensis]Q2SML2.1 RecName: Full=Ribosome-binding factor A [Hahella chejuensis KCTC 2396]ABC28112.1 ribosome-binding factor A [Hahella chejuensis KCTC 2396]